LNFLTRFDQTKNSCEIPSPSQSQLIPILKGVGLIMCYDDILNL